VRWLATHRLESGTGRSSGESASKARVMLPSKTRESANDVPRSVHDDLRSAFRQPSVVARSRRTSPAIPEDRRDRAAVRQRRTLGWQNLSAGTDGEANQLVQQIVGLGARGIGKRNRSFVWIDRAGLEAAMSTSCVPICPRTAAAAICATTVLARSLSARFSTSLMRSRMTFLACLMAILQPSRRVRDQSSAPDCR
jgi:hypothetical protein